jgi:hypothetical protein
MSSRLLAGFYGGPPNEAPKPRSSELRLRTRASGVKLATTVPECGSTARFPLIVNALATPELRALTSSVTSNRRLHDPAHP